MTDNQKTWTVLSLFVVMLLLILWLFEKRRKDLATQTSVNLDGAEFRFPIRNETNQRLLRQCHYSNGHVVTLDPDSAGGQCPPVFTDLAGNSGNLTKDEIIAIPQAGQSTVYQTPPYVPPLNPQ